MLGNLKLREKLLDGHRCPPVNRLSTDTDVRRNRIGPYRTVITGGFGGFRLTEIRPHASNWSSARRGFAGSGLQGGEFVGWQDEGLTPVPEILVQHDHEDGHSTLVTRARTTFRPATW